MWLDLLGDDRIHWLSAKDVIYVVFGRRYES